MSFGRFPFLFSTFDTLTSLEPEKTAIPVFRLRDPSEQAEGTFTAAVSSAIEE